MDIDTHDGLVEVFVRSRVPVLEPVERQLGPVPSLEQLPGLHSVWWWHLLPRRYLTGCQAI